jgi:hypothetical protein
MQQKIPVYLNGLFPNLTNEENIDGSSIIILDPELTPSDPEFVLLRGQANRSGVFEGAISARLVAKKVTLRVRHVNFKEHEVDINIQSYGLYHTVKLEKCYVYNPQPTSKTWKEWSSHVQYAQALDELQKVVAENSKLSRQA